MSSVRHGCYFWKFYEIFSFFNSNSNFEFGLVGNGRNWNRSGPVGSVTTVSGLVPTGSANPGRRLARGERRPSGQHGGGAMSDEGPRAEEGHDRRYAGVPAGARAGRRWNMSPRPSSSFPFTVLGLDWTLPTNHVGAGVIWFD
jgi:hypothetical protein